MIQTTHMPVRSAEPVTALRQASDRLARCLADSGIAAEYRLLRVLDLRCKLEQLAVLPLLREIGALGERSLNESERDIASLRHQLQTAFRQPVAGGMSVTESRSVLAETAARHFARIDRLLADPRLVPVLRERALGEEIADWTRRWCSEITATGDIEDEERDPVGAPPR